MVYDALRLKGKGYSSFNLYVYEWKILFLPCTCIGKDDDRKEIKHRALFLKGKFGGAF